MGLSQWMEARSTAAMDRWCRQQYVRRLKSDPVLALVSQARAAGWDDERIIWRLHETQWPAVVREAAEKMGARHAASTLFRLTETQWGKESETHALADAFRAIGFDLPVIARAVERGNNGEFNEDS